MFAFQTRGNRGNYCTILKAAYRLLLFSSFSVAAFAQCTFAVTPPSPFPSKVFVDALGYLDLAHDPLVIPVSASAQTCAWTAEASDGFATVSGANGATGNGSVTYLIPQNTTNVARTVTLMIAGTAITLTQDATASLFTDVPPNDPFNSGFFDGINLMYTNDISKGTKASPLTYGANLSVTRDQMAVFIVRTILGGGPNVDNFSYSATPYFTDVPPTYPFFKWIQKLRDLGITAGTTSTTYGPLLGVTRDQMAVFIVRARLGATTAFNPPVAQQFNDVAPTGPEAFYYPYIQELKEIGITSGTSTNPPLYSPQLAVTRGQMAVFLVRAGFNTLLNSTLPLLTQLSSTSAAPGAAPFTLTVKGLNTHFSQGNTTILSDDGVTFGIPTVADATNLSVTMTVPAGTPLGQISITAQTELSAGVYEAATAPNLFTVGSGDPAPSITSFTPTSGPVGTEVTITGSTLVSSLGTPVTVLVPLQGGGTTPAPVAAATATSVSFVVPSTAATGNIQVLSFSGGANSATPFTVTPSSTYTIGASPSTANVIAGQSTTYTITASSSSGFTGLAHLSLAGLPAGLTSSFNPGEIAAGEQSTLTISAPANQAINTANLAITATATVDGIAVPAGTTATLNVTPVTTSFLGRTVVDNTTNTSIAGVTVTMVGQDGAGNKTGCTGSTISDGSGNFALTNLAAACLGPQLIGFDGNHVTSPAGTYAGLQLVFTLVENTVVVSPVLVHLPRVDNVETFLVTQNATVDQTYKFKSIPNLSVTVYAGTTFTQQDGSQPDPFPLAAIQVPVDRLPDVMPTTTASVMAFIVAFQPAETNASQPVAVWFPNTLNTPPGTTGPLMTLDPTLGRMAPYGVGTVSMDGTTIIPGIDPSTSAQHRYGIVHFDWHGFGPPPVPGLTVSGTNPSGDLSHENSSGVPAAPSDGDPVDLSSGIGVNTSTDIAIAGNLGTLALIRTQRTLSIQAPSLGPFGWGTSHNFDYRLDTSTPQTAALVNFILPQGTLIPFSRQADNTLVNSTTPMFAGWVMTTASDGTTVLREKSGIYMQFVPANFIALSSVLVAVGDTNGNVTKIVRNSNPYEITEIDDPAGRKLAFQYDSASRITQVTDSIGRTVSYTYNAAGYLESFTNLLGGVTQYEYDSQGRLTQTTDPRGVVVSSTFDSNGRVSTQTLPSGGTMTFAYTLVNALVPTSPVTQTVVTDPLGHTTTYRFNTQGFLTGVTDALGQVRSMTRQSGTNFLTSITGNGTCPSCGGTQAGDFSYTYDAFGNKLSETDALGNTTAYTYEPVFNRVASITDPMGGVARFTYDDRGNLVTRVDPRGNTISYSYMASGLVASFTDESRQTISYGYDAAGNLQSVTDAQGNNNKLVHDGISRLVGQQESKGALATAVYNAIGAPTSIVEANGRTTTFSWDQAGYLTSYTSAGGGTVSFGYDAGGRQVTRKDQLGGTTTYVYDSINNVVGYTNRRGQAATYKYDVLNRLITEQYVDASVTRSWDSNSRLSRVVDSAAGNFTMAWDAAGRLVKQVGPFGEVNYTRDAKGRVASRQVVGDPKVTYSYDADDNLVQASMTGATVSQTFDPRNHVTGRTRSNGVNGAYSFDSLGQLLSIVEQSGQNGIVARNYGYDGTGSITSQGEEAGLPLATPTAPATWNAANQLVSGGPLASKFTYDADGNRLTDASASGNASYTWDARGRLQAVSAGGVVTGFAYDYDGNLIQKSTSKAGGAVVEHYILDDLTNVVKQDKVGVGGVAMLTGRRLDETFAFVSGGSAVFPLIDIQNNTVALTDANANVTGNVYYEPYGKTTESGSTGLLEFTGRQQAVADLYYLRARYLDVRNGLFISEDPSGLAGGDPDLYRYAAANPIGAMDPRGLHVYSIGVSVNVQLGPVNLNANVGVAVDTHGGVAVTRTVGAGAGIGAEANASLSFSHSTGDTVKDLGGWSTNTSGGGGAGVTGSIDGSISTGANGQASLNSEGKPTTSVGASLGVGGGADVAVTRTYTKVDRIF